MCEFSGATRRYSVALCFLGRRGLCTGFRSKVSSVKEGRKPVGSRSWGGCCAEGEAVVKGFKT